MATAPLRKCIAGDAGTPVTEAPSALVTIGFPLTVTLTMTDLRESGFTAFRTMATIAAASSLGVAPEARGGVSETHKVPGANANRTWPTPTGRTQRPH